MLHQQSRSHAEVRMRDRQMLLGLRTASVIVNPSLPVRLSLKDFGVEKTVSTLIRGDDRATFLSLPRLHQRGSSTDRIATRLLWISSPRHFSFSVVIVLSMSILYGIRLINALAHVYEHQKCEVDRHILGRWHRKHQPNLGKTQIC